MRKYFTVRVRRDSHSTLDRPTVDKDFRPRLGVDNRELGSEETGLVEVEVERPMSLETERRAWVSASNGELEVALAAAVASLTFLLASASDLAAMYALRANASSAQVQIGMGYLASTIFSGTRAASIVLYLLTLITCIVAIVIWLTNLTTGTDAWPWAMDFYPPFAAYHCMLLATEKGFTVGMLSSDPKMGIAFRFLGLHLL